MSDDKIEIFIGRPRSKRYRDGFVYTRFDEVIDYQVSNDMLELADGWSIHLPFSWRGWQHAAPDNPIIIELNGAPILTGLIDDSERVRSRADGSAIALSGRDRGGRLVDESAPLVSIAGMGILELGRAMAGFWFNEVTLQNATNRRLRGGGAGAQQARVSREPAIDQGHGAKKKITPGETRSQVLGHYLEKAGLLGWSSADGRQFVIGRPNYDQEPQFEVRSPIQGSKAPPGRDAIMLRHKESTGERYARITVLGTGQGDSTNHGKNVRRRNVVRQGPNEDGTGKSFIIPKELIILDEDLPTAKEAEERAEREMALRESTSLQANALMAGHSQAMASGVAANWSPDRMVRLVDEEIEAKGNPREWLITRVEFAGSRSAARTTQLTLVPKGTDLRGVNG